jgi:hypothetical protein
MCAQHIFFDGSAKKWSFASAFEKWKFTSAFKHAVAVFSKQASASGFLDEIEPWVDRHTEDMTNLDHCDDPDLFRKAPLIKNGSHCAAYGQYGPGSC